MVFEIEGCEHVDLNLLDLHYGTGEETTEFVMTLWKIMDGQKLDHKELHPLIYPSFQKSVSKTNHEDNFHKKWFCVFKRPDEKLSEPFVLTKQPSWILFPKVESTEKTFELSKGVFPCKPGTTWQDVTITLLAHDLVRIKTPEGEDRVTYHQLGMADKRKGDTPTILWETLKVLLINKGTVSRENIEYNSKLPDNFKRLNNHLKELFQIDESAFPHYKKEKGYKAKFNCRNDTYLTLENLSDY